MVQNGMYEQIFNEALIEFAEQAPVVNPNPENVYSPE